MVKRTLVAACVAAAGLTLAILAGAAPPPGKCNPHWPCPTTTTAPATTTTVPTTTTTPTTTSTPTTTTTTTTPPPVDPSGQPMPTGDLPGWHQIFTDNFATDVPLGDFTHANQPKWNPYPYPWKDTSGNGTYWPEKGISVHDGMMDLWLHTVTVNGTTYHISEAPQPVLPLSTRGQLYGRYAIRFKIDPVQGYKTAWLLWPDDGNRAEGELDFPEGNLTGNINGYVHPVNYGSQATFNTSTPEAGAWHTAVMEWSPGDVKYLLDGTKIGESTSGIPDTLMHYVIQTETMLDGTVPPDTASGHVLIDWVSVYSYAPSSTTTTTTTTVQSSAPWKWDAASAPIDPNSASEIKTWLGYAIVNPNMPTTKWAVAPADAGTGDPTYTIPLTKQGGTLSVRVKVGTKPDPSGDGHLTVRDTAAGTETDFWQAVYDSTTGRIASASAAVKFPLGSVNEQTTGWGGDAANLPLRRGLITPDDIASGVIDHPLVFGNPDVGVGSPRYPALHNVATTSAAGYLVEGTWLRMDPAVDCASYGLPAWQRMVCVALQRYGMFLRDNSGSLAIYGANPVNGGTQWSQVGVSGGSAAFSAGFPWSRMQVLQPPAH